MSLDRVGDGIGGSGTKILILLLYLNGQHSLILYPSRYLVKVQFVGNENQRISKKIEIQYAIDPLLV